MKAQLFAIFNGLKVAWNKEFTKRCRVDSLHAVSLINNTIEHYHRFSTTIAADIKAYLCRAWEVEVRHSFREGN